MHPVSVVVSWILGEAHWQGRNAILRSCTSTTAAAAWDHDTFDLVLDLWEEPHQGSALV